jgi:hypothetical protein
MMRATAVARGRGGAEGPPRRRHLEEHDAQGVNVRPGVQVAGLLDLLRRHVVRRAQDHALRVHQRRVGHGAAGDAEVRQGEPAPRTEQHVLRFEVPVDDADGVHGAEAGAQREPERGDLGDGQGGLARQAGREGRALDVLHRQEDLAIGLAQVEHAGHVRVRHAPGELDLLPEPGALLGVVHELTAQHLERHGLVEGVVVHAVDAAHPAYAQEREHGVAFGDAGLIEVRIVG